MFDQLACQFPLRPYQQRAVAFAARELQRPAEGARRWHFVAPPGSGKTILGLELIRRLALPAVIFSPNTAIQRQWVDKVAHFLPPESPALDPAPIADHYADPPAPILSLTYQSLATASRETALLDRLARALWVAEAGDEAQLAALRAAQPEEYRRELRRFRSRVRRRLLDEPDFDPTPLLHPSARALVEGLVARGTRTVVLDECHHLVGTWAILLAALLRRLEDPIIIGLTATPPLDRSHRERRRYLDLVGEVDLQVPTPAVVRDGNLAPYQDLAYFTAPTPAEMRFIAAQHAHWHDLLARLNQTGRLDEWLRRRLTAPQDQAGQPLPLDTFVERRAPLACALARWFLAHDWPLPPDLPLTREMVEPLALEDRLRLLADFALHHLRLSQDPADRALYHDLRGAGRSLGYHLTESGFRRTVAPVDRLLSLSRAKQEAALTILRHEWQALGERLRAVIITDFERSSATVLRQLRGVLDPDTESALGTMRLLAQSDLEGALRPVLVTGRTLLCDDQVAATFLDAARAWFATRGLTVTLHDERVEGASFHRIVGSGPDWRTGSYVAMVTTLLAEGVTRCVVGTRALLGEGWDSLALNTFIDLTYATTFASVNQLRGRAIRKDPNWPDKVANNWDVVCLAPGYDKGLRDYERFTRKHENFFGIADDGSIEAGVGHVHPRLSDLDPTTLAAEMDDLNQRMLARAARRAEIAALWRVGTPYEGMELHALDLRPPAPGPALSRVGRARREEALRALPPLAALGGAAAVTLALTPVISALGAGLIQAGAEAWLTGGYQLGPLRLGIALTWLLLSAGVLGRAALLLVRRLGQQFWSEGSSGTIRAMAQATLEAMQATELLPATIPPEALHVAPREGGLVRVWLERPDPAEVERFARAMAELLGPVTSEFRYMIPRHEILLPDQPLARLWPWLRWATNRWAGETVAWHPIPHELGVRAERVRAFEEAWQRHVSPGEAVYLRRADAAQRLRAARALPPATERHPKRIWR